MAPKKGRPLGTTKPDSQTRIDEWNQKAAGGDKDPLVEVTMKPDKELSPPMRLIYKYLKDYRKKNQAPNGHSQFQLLADSAEESGTSVRRAQSSISTSCLIFSTLLVYDQISGNIYSLNLQSDKISKL